MSIGNADIKNASFEDRSDPGQTVSKHHAMTYVQTNRQTNKKKDWISALQLRLRRLHDDNDNERRHHQRKGHQRHDENGTATRRKLALQDPLLALVVAVVAQEQDEHADAQKSGAQRTADVP
jgi:hypothetical protein